MTLNNPQNSAEQNNKKTPEKLREHFDPKAQEFLDGVTQRMHASLSGTPEVIDFDDRRFAAATDKLLQHYQEWPRNVLESGLKQAIAGLITLETASPAPSLSGTSIENLIQYYVFHLPAEKNPETYAVRFRRLQRFLFANVYCVFAQEGAEEEATRAAQRMFWHKVNHINPYERSYESAGQAGLNAEQKAEKQQLRQRAESDEMKASAGATGLYLEEPIILMATTTETVRGVEAPEVAGAIAYEDAPDRSVPYLVHNFQLSSDAVQQLYTRQFIDQLAHTPGAKEHLGLRSSDLLNGLRRSKLLPTEVFDPTLDTNPDITPEKRAYYQMLRDAVLQTEAWLGDATLGQKRKDYLQGRMQENLLGRLADPRIIQDASLLATFEGILRGEEKYRNAEKRKQLETLQQILQPYFARTTPEVTFENNPAYDDLLKIDGHNPTLRDDLLERTKNFYEVLNRLPERHTLGGYTVDAAQKFLDIDAETDDVPETLSDKDFDDFKDYIAIVRTTEPHFTALVEGVRDAIFAHKKDLKNLVQEDVLRGERSPDTDIVENAFAHILSKRFVFGDLDTAVQDQLQQAKIFRGTAWTTDPAVLEESLRGVISLRQHLRALEDMHSHIGTSTDSFTAFLQPSIPESAYDFSKVLTTEEEGQIEKALEAYHASSSAEGTNWQWIAAKDALQARIDAEENALAKATDEHKKEAIQKRLDALRILEQRMAEEGHLTLKGLEDVQSHPDGDLHMNADTEEAFRNLIHEGILHSAEAHAEMDFLDSTQQLLTPEELNEIYSYEQEGEHAVLREHVANSPRERIVDFLEQLSSGAKRFTSVLDAQAELNAMYKLLREINPSLPDISKGMRIGEGVWVQIQGTKSVPAKPARRGQKAQEATTEKVDFFKNIVGASVAEGVTFGGEVGSLPLEQYVYHLINGAFDPAAKFSITWRHDNVQDPVTNLEQLKEKNLGLDETSLAKGAVISRGGERYGKVIKPDARHQGLKGVWISYDVEEEGKEGKNKKTKKFKEFISYTELYLMKAHGGKDSITAQGYDTEDFDAAGESGVKMISLSGLLLVGKSIFTHRQDQVKKWREMRRTLEALYLFPTESSLWVHMQNEMEAKEADIAKGYKTSLENLQSDQLEEFFVKEFARFDKLNLNQVSTGNTITYSMNQKPIFVERAEFKALMIFILEKYGNLYPFEKLAKYRQEQWWLKKIGGTKEEIDRGFQFAEKNKGTVDGKSEIWRVAGLARARRNLYGDTFAHQIEDAHGKGKSNAKSSKEAAASLTQNTGQMKDLLTGYLKNRDWSGIEVVFNKLVMKDVPSEQVFNMFLFLYSEITKQKDGSHGLPPHVTFEELKNVAGAVFPQSPELYFFFLKVEGNVRALDKFLFDVDNNVFNYEWREEGGVLTPYSKGKKSDMWKAFTMEGSKKSQGDYRLLNGYQKAIASGDMDSNYVTYLQKINQPLPSLKPSEQDVKMWCRSPLLYINNAVVSELLYKQINPSGFTRGFHSYNYMEALLENIEDLKTSTTINDFDKQAYLNRLKRIIYEELYAQFHFEEQRSYSNNAGGTVGTGMISDTQFGGDKIKRRDGFMRNYYSRLKSLGFTVQKCAEAAEIKDKIFLEHGEGINKDHRDYLVLGISPQRLQERATKGAKATIGATDSDLLDTVA